CRAPRRPADRCGAASRSRRPRSCRSRAPARARRASPRRRARRLPPPRTARPTCARAGRTACRRLRSPPLDACGPPFDGSLTCHHNNRIKTMALVVLGCGWIARRHAADARRLRLPLIFASRDVARARAYAREFGGVGAYGGYAGALGGPRARAAPVCTPHGRHLHDVLQALPAGRPLLLEKPLPRPPQGADRIIEAAARAG